MGTTAAAVTDIPRSEQRTFLVLSELTQSGEPLVRRVFTFLPTFAWSRLRRESRIFRRLKIDGMLFEGLRII